MLVLVGLRESARLSVGRLTAPVQSGHQLAVLVRRVDAPAVLRRQPYTTAGQVDLLSMGCQRRYHAPQLLSWPSSGRVDLPTMRSRAFYSMSTGARLPTSSGDDGRQPTTTTTTTTTTSSGDVTTSSDDTGKAQASRMARLWAAVKHEVKHYWTGTKLLSANVSVSWSLVGQLLRGQELTRREKRLLKRTVRDILRVFPFLLFVIIPLAEFALPIFLKLFPNMLPSTFETSLQREENLQQALRIRLEMTKFLQDTVMSLAKKKKEHSAEITTLLERARQGQELTSDEILKVASFFEDDFALENLNREQLVAICKFLNVQTLGTSALLRYRLESRFKELHQDDQVIKAEGLASLTSEELQAACAARGMRAINVSQQVLTRQLNQWLDLSLNQNLPVGLMVISRVLTINAKPGQQPAANRSDFLDSIVQHIKHMPNEDFEAAWLDSALDQGDQSHLEVLNSFRQKLKDSKGKSKAQVVTEFAGTLDDSKEKEAVLRRIYTALEMMTKEPLKQATVELEDMSLILNDSDLDDAAAKRLKPLMQALEEKLSKEMESADQTLRARLHFLDRDGDGLLSKTEIRMALRHTTIADDKMISEIFELLDSDKDDLIRAEDLEKAIEDVLAGVSPSKPVVKSATPPTTHQRL